ncbi:MAG: relaxase, partial [Sphingomonadales bacterium CG_4_10_14_3_um_filter_58_15]
MSSENEHVTLHEISGFASNDLAGALKEAEAISRGTKCQKFLYSLSLNPPGKESVETEVFLDTISRVEAKLGLEGQPKAVVFHEKENRRHCHVVWSRIDADAMKAITLSFPKRK